MVSLPESLNEVMDRLQIPKPVREEAVTIYEKALAEGIARGRSISIVAAASLYAACRIAQMPVTLEEIYPRRRAVGRCYRALLRELELKFPPVEVEAWVPKVAARVGIGEEVQRKAVEIIKEAQRLRLTSGRGEFGITAAALYIANHLCCEYGEWKTQAELAEAAGISAVTLRNRYKEMVKHIQFIIIM